MVHQIQQKMLELGVGWDGAGQDFVCMHMQGNVGSEGG